VGFWGFIGMEGTLFGHSLVFEWMQIASD